MADETKPSEIEEKLKASAPNNQNNNDSPKNEQKEKTQSPLEEIAAGARNLAWTAVGAASPFVFSGADRANALVTGPSLQAGAMLDDIMANKPVDFKKAGKEGIVGTIMTKPLAWMFGSINYVRDYVTANAGIIPGGAAAVGTLAGLQAVFIGMYTGLNHIIQNVSFKGLYDKFKKDYKETVKRTWKIVLPFSALNVTVLPYTALYQSLGVVAQLAYGSLMTFLFRLVGPTTKGASLGNLIRKANPLQYIPSTFSFVGKAAKTAFYGVPNAAYTIGKSAYDFIRDLYKSPPQTAAPTQTAPARA